MGPRERSDSGTFVETVSLEDVLGVFDTVRGPVITSSDVADQLDCTTEAARQKLTRLYDQGKVDKRKTGRTVVWWHTGGERITPSERTGVRQGESETSPDTVETADPVPAEDDEEDVEDALGAAVRELDLEGSGTVLEAREDALIDIVRTLREEGQATAEELKETVDADAVGYKSANNFWSNMRRQNVFESLPVETPGRGGRTYTYTGDDVQTDGGIYDPTEEF